MRRPKISQQRRQTDDQKHTRNSGMNIKGQLGTRWIVGMALLALAVGPAAAADKKTDDVITTPPPGSFVLVVMDPLALPLSCPCVKGYAQRDYDKLGKHIEGRI